jgi:hypothetical protein
MFSRPGVCGRHPCNEIAAPAKQGSPHHWQFSKAHTGSRFAIGFEPSLCIDYIKDYAGNKQNSYKIMKMQMFATLDKAKPRLRKYRSLKLGGSQAYNRSSD